MITPEDIERYAEEHSTTPDSLLAELEAETRATLDLPEMLAGPLQGRFLEFLVYSLRPRRVLEIGAYSGYSALSMASGLPPDGRIDTCEINEEHAEVAREFVARSPYADRITVHVGPALETIATLEGEFDFVFIDADKSGYVDYYEAVLPRLSEHALIAADNTLSGGHVIDEDADARTNAIVRFNEHVREDQRAISVMLPLRDGVTLIRRR